VGHYALDGYKAQIETDESNQAVFAAGNIKHHVGLHIVRAAEGVLQLHEMPELAGFDRLAVATVTKNLSSTMRGYLRMAMAAPKPSRCDLFRKNWGKIVIFSELWH